MDRLMINNVVAAAMVKAEKVITDVAVDSTAVEGEPVMTDGTYTDGMYTDPMLETGMAEVKDPILASWPFVIGISGIVLFVSIALGAFLARRKIKKGIELYED